MSSHIFFFFLQDLQIISTDENQVFVAVQEWYQTDTYNLYQSDPQGVYYSILLENVRSTKQPEENVLIDILEVRHQGTIQILDFCCFLSLPFPLFWPAIVILKTLNFMFIMFSLVLLSGKKEVESCYYYIINSSSLFSS